MYKSCSIKQIIFNKYATNLKTISHRSLRISGLLLLKFFNFNLVFLINIIGNIITYSPYYITQTSANGSAVLLSRDTDGNHVTSILHCHFSSPFNRTKLFKGTIVNRAYPSLHRHWRVTYMQSL